MRTNKHVKIKHTHIYMQYTETQDKFVGARAQLMKTQNHLVLVNGIGQAFACRNLVTSRMSHGGGRRWSHWNVASLVLSRLDYGNATLYGLPGNQIDRLQSAMNAAARLVFSAQKYKHVTPLLCDLHWLRVSDRIEFKLSVLVFRCLHSIAPAYLSDELHRVADSGTRRRLRSTSSPALVVPPTRRTTIGDLSFPVAGVRVWNALPSVTDSSTIERYPPSSVT